MSTPKAYEPSDDVEEGWGEGTDPSAIPGLVRGAYSALAGPIEVRSLSTGLLHRSFHVRGGHGEYVLQRVSDVFAPEIHENIAAVTHHLRQRGLVTFELVPTKEGALCAEFGLHGRWRLLTHLDGISFEEVQSRAQARSAAELIGRFHAALDDFEAPLAPMGIPFRNTALYLARMDRALDEHAGHRLGEPVRGIAQQIHTGFERLGPPMAAPERVIHGDLKLANILFEGSEPPARDRALALIDFDTLMRAPLWSEWGDAWRSWCAVGGDENEERSFDLAIFESSRHRCARGVVFRVGRSALFGGGRAPSGPRSRSVGSLRGCVGLPIGASRNPGGDVGLTNGRGDRASMLDSP
jgi:Ser/Thr protein kinase RdoA (MazF antagonist)